MNPVPSHDLTTGRLRQVQGGLTVSLIMVPRGSLMKCSRSDRQDELRRRNVNDYSALPVVGGDDRIIGLYDASRWFKEPAPPEPVGNNFTPISEDILIGADASIFDFIRTADSHPTRFVVREHGIAGMVSLSDIQHLPVRAALFTLITGFEMAMAALIELVWPNGDWQTNLNPERRAYLADEITKAREQDTYTGDLVLTQFCDKATLVRKTQRLKWSNRQIMALTGRAEKLRNKLAHGNHYAATIDEAEAICRMVRGVFDLQEQIEQLLSPTAPSQDA